MALELNTIFELLLMAFVVSASFYVGYTFDNVYAGTQQWLQDLDIGLEINQQQLEIEKQDIINNCNNTLGVNQFSHCLVDNIKPFYKYNITDDSIQLSFQELKEYGGDCKDWSELYHELAKLSGYDSVLRDYNGIVNIKPGHQWATIYNETEYCKIDLLRVNCFKVTI